MLDLNFNHRLWAWILSNALMLYHAAILLSREPLCPVGTRAKPWSYYHAPSAQAEKYRNNLWFWSFVQRAALCSSYPPTQQCSGFLRWMETPCSLLSANPSPCGRLDWHVTYFATSFSCGKWDLHREVPPFIPRVKPGRGWANQAQDPVSISSDWLGEGCLLNRATKLWHFIYLFI